MKNCAKRWLCAVGLLAVSFAHAEAPSLRIGDSKGVYKALLNASGELKNIPYTIEWSEFPATAPALEALAAGAIDLRVSAGAPLIFALASGAPIKAVAAMRLEGPRELLAILVPPNSAIHSVADLRGKRIGTNKGSIGHHLILAALQHANIPFDQVTIQFLLPAEARAALLGGSIDAWSTWDPYVAIAEVQDHLRPVVDGTGLAISDGDVVTSNAAIASKRALLEDLLPRLNRAQAWAMQHHEEYAQLYASQTGLQLDVTRLVIKHLNYRYVPIDDSIVHDHQDTADLYLKAGIIKQPINVSAAFDRSVFK